MSSSFGGFGSGGGSIFVNALFSHLFSTDISFPSVIFSILVGFMSTGISRFMSTALFNTEVKFCSNWSTSLIGDTD